MSSDRGVMLTQVTVGDRRARTADCTISSVPNPTLRRLSFTSLDRTFGVVVDGSSVSPHPSAPQPHQHRMPTRGIGRPPARQPAQRSPRRRSAPPRGIVARVAPGKARQPSSIRQRPIEGLIAPDWRPTSARSSRTAGGLPRPAGCSATACNLVWIRLRLSGFLPCAITVPTATGSALLQCAPSS